MSDIGSKELLECIQLRHLIIIAGPPPKPGVGAAEGSSVVRGEVVEGGEGVKGGGTKDGEGSG